METLGDCAVPQCTAPASVSITHARTGQVDKLCREHALVAMDIHTSQGKTAVVACQWQRDDGSRCPEGATGIALLADADGSEDRIPMCETHFAVFRRLALSVGKVVVDNRPQANN